MSLSIIEKTARIKQIAKRLGFDACGIAKSKPIGEIAESRFRNWLEKDHHAEMSYMANHFALRCDPTLLVENSKSIVVVALNYFPKTKQQEQLPQIAYYAYGKDYHDVIRAKLNQFMQLINEEIEPVSGRGFVDSAPVLERHWAQQSGIGWLGKNNLLIIPRMGSFFLLAELIIDLKLEYDLPMENRCGECHRCIDACPTNALKPHLLDARQCLSYLTIEKRNEFTHDEPSHLHNRLFGCDICQTVCPWNKFAKPTHVDEFAPTENILIYSKEQWHEMDENTFRTTLRHSPIKRTKYTGIQRNLNRL